MHHSVQCRPSSSALGLAPPSPPDNRALTPGRLDPWVSDARALGWPFCWWVMLAVDHYSRWVMWFGDCRREPKPRRSGRTGQQLQPLRLDLASTLRQPAPDELDKFTDHVFLLDQCFLLYLRKLLDFAFHS